MHEYPEGSGRLIQDFQGTDKFRLSGITRLVIAQDQVTSGLAPVPEI